MKTNVGELRGLNDAELQKQLDDLYQEQFNLRFQNASGQVKDQNRFKTVRRQIARIKTLQQQRVLAGVTSNKGRRKMSERKYKGKVMVGKVVSDKMEKTVVVVVETRRRHPLYGKIITMRRRFKAHNEDPKAKAGDVVKITESRPLSRDKRWRVAEIVRTGEVVEMIRETELEGLIEKERTEKQARKDEEQARAWRTVLPTWRFRVDRGHGRRRGKRIRICRRYEGSDSDEFAASAEADDEENQE